MQRKLVSVLLVLLDAIIVAITPFFALYIRFEGNIDKRYLDLILSYLPEIILVRLITFYFFGLYRRLWRYASIPELLSTIMAVSFSSCVIVLYMHMTGANTPRSISIISWLLVVGFVGMSRLVMRMVHITYYHHSKKQVNRTIIIGAGDAGAMIAREILQRYPNTKLVGFIDDDGYKQNRMLFGVRILGGCHNIKSISLKHNVNEIIIAIPSLDGVQLRKIIQECKQTGCNVRTVPGIHELIDGKVTVQQLRDVDLEDLLRRDPVSLDLKQIAGYISGKRVLVTGAGGSIGSELCRQIAKLSPQEVFLLGKGENSIYEIDRELREKYSELKFEPIIADIRDKNRIDEIFKHVKPHVVFHAAAHKHVPLMEAQPAEAVSTNIFGTKTVAEAARHAGSSIFIMVSTDKAVNPTSVMGATKRVAEQIVQSLNQGGTTKFAAVRFGNVLGSRGSVVPLFKRQIAKGGPITITHPDMRRYFMTIPEATQLVLQAGSMAAGGEVFVLDMGEPIRIVDMANDLIELSGLEPGKDVEIQFTGLRPGEKLFEELLTAEEGTASTKHEKIYVANLKTVSLSLLKEQLETIRNVSDSDNIVLLLEKIVPNYCHSKHTYCQAAATKTENDLESRTDVIVKSEVGHIYAS